MSRGVRGAGRGGGLLFAGVLGFTAVLAFGALEGLARALVVGGIVFLLVVILASTVRRR